MNAIIKESDFRKQIKSSPATGYLFFGEEDYMKKFALDCATEAISPDPSFAFFNEIRLDSFTYSPSALVDAFMPAPMMADRKLVVLSGVDFNAMRSHEVDALCSALESLSDYDYNTLIINASADRLDGGNMPKKPSALLKKIMEFATPVQFEPSSPAKLAVWAARHFEHEGIKVTDSVAKYLIEYCGTGMFELSNEIKKLSAYLHAHGRDEVTAEDIRFVAVPETEFDQFAFSNAAMNGKRAEALEALAVMKFRQVKPEYALAEIAGLYSNMYMTKLLKESGATTTDIAKIIKVHEFKVGLYLKATEHATLDRLKRSLELCLDADLAMKTYGKRNYEQIEKLICLL